MIEIEIFFFCRQGLDYRKSDKVEVLESTVKFLKEKKQNRKYFFFCILFSQHWAFPEKI